MSDLVYIMKIAFHPVKSDQISSGTIQSYIGHEFIRMERDAALRFLYEIHVSCEGSSAKRVNTDAQVAVGVHTDKFIYELVGG